MPAKYNFAKKKNEGGMRRKTSKLRKSRWGSRHMSWSKLQASKKLWANICAQLRKAKTNGNNVAAIIISIQPVRKKGKIKRRKRVAPVALATAK